MIEYGGLLGMIARSLEDAANNLAGVIFDRFADLLNWLIEIWRGIGH